LTTTKDTVLDAVGRASQIKVDGAVLYTLGYDAEGRVARADFASGEALTFSYDPTTHQRRGHDVAAPAASGGVHWERDARGLIASETYSTGATTTQRTYGYDGRGALILSTTPQATATYSYAPSGLPDSITDALGTRTVRRDGATLAVGDVVYAWDTAGRVIAKDGWSFRYGPSGQISHAERAGRQIDYVYDDENHRLLKRVDGVPVRADAADGVLTEDHFLELVVIGGVVAGVLDNGQFTALLTDPRGTPFAGPDGTPGLASPFGVRTAHLGYSEVIDYAKLGWDSDLDIIRMGVRDYDPKLSQFWTPDPLYFEDLEKCQTSPLQCALYGYASGNPLSFVDPTGTDWQDWAGAAVGGVVGAFDALTFGLYSKHAIDRSTAAVVNATTYYHTGYVAGEIATNAGLIAIGVGEVSAAIKAGQFGVRMLVTADGMTMLAVGDSTVAAAKGAGAIVYGTASFATSLSDKGGGGLTEGSSEGAKPCECSRAEDTSSGAGDGSGRGTNRLRPDPSAQGPHTTFKTDAKAVSLVTRNGSRTRVTRQVLIKRSASMLRETPTSTRPRARMCQHPTFMRTCLVASGQLDSMRCPNEKPERATDRVADVVVPVAV
jgi:RHS repeat-associated protein